MKLRSICTTKEMTTTLKRYFTGWERIFAHHPSNKGLISKIYKIHKNLTRKRN